MKKERTFIEVSNIDISRPKERPPKTNWKTDMLKKGIVVLQHFSPKMASEIIWKQFTKPGPSRFTENQLKLLKEKNPEEEFEVVVVEAEGKEDLSKVG